MGAGGSFADSKATDIGRLPLTSTSCRAETCVEP